MGSVSGKVVAIGDVSVLYMVRSESLPQLCKSGGMGLKR